MTRPFRICMGALSVAAIGWIVVTQELTIGVKFASAILPLIDLALVIFLPNPYKATGYMVVYTTREKDCGPNDPGTDHYSVFIDDTTKENKAAAIDAYKKLKHLATVYSASVVKIITSTDY